MTRARRSAGFTLIELLVAISILAIVAVLGWRGLDSIVRARIALTAQIESTRGMQLAFAQMQSDADHIASSAMLQNRPALSGENGSMALVRHVYNENETGRLQVVSYRVRDGRLERRESIATRDLMQLDMLWKGALASTDPTPPVVLHTGVTGMTAQLWQGNRWTMLGPGAPVNPPPTGLQVSLQIEKVQTLMVKNFLLGGV